MAVLCGWETCENCDHEKRQLQNRIYSNGGIMTEKQFMTLCEKYQVDPADAWDNESLKEALLWRDDETVEEILKNDY